MWWQALSLLEKIFICIAIPSTVLLVVQFILTLIGIDGNADGDVDGNFDGIDLDGDGIPDTDAPGDSFNDGVGFRLFSLRSLIAFFAVMSWTGFAMAGAGVHPAITCLVAVAAGFVMMLAVALIYYFFAKMQTSGNVNIQNAVGTSGSVYLSIPPKRSGKGKVNLVVQERFGEYDAVTDEEEALPFGCEVVVIGLSGQDTLLVKRK